jgi:hypothetical protein
VNVLFHLLPAYGMVGLVVCILWGTMRSRVVRRRSVFAIALFPAAVPLTPYAVVECQTALCRTSLMPAIRQALHETGSTDHILLFKVLSWRPTSARAYVVTPCWGADGRSFSANDRAAVTYELVRTPQGWAFNGNWDAVWSDCGSAHGTVFPPYPGKGEHP